MNRSAEEMIDALEFAALDRGGAITFLAGDNELARVVAAWRKQNARIAELEDGIRATIADLSLSSHPHCRDGSSMLEKLLTKQQ